MVSSLREEKALKTGGYNVMKIIMICTKNKSAKKNSKSNLKNQGKLYRKRYTWVYSE